MLLLYRRELPQTLGINVKEKNLPIEQKKKSVPMTVFQQTLQGDMELEFHVIFTHHQYYLVIFSNYLKV